MARLRYDTLTHLTKRRGLSSNGWTFGLVPFEEAIYSIKRCSISNSHLCGASPVVLQSAHKFPFCT